MISVISVLLLLNVVDMGLAAPVVTLGNMILRDSGFELLKGHRVAVLTNPTGVFVDNMKHIVDVMNDDSGVDIVAVFGPEHGFRGDKQAETGDPLFYIDESTQLPVFSAYNMTSLEISGVMERLNITTVVVDMQDVGVRLYTFIWTMYDVMAGAKIALDRGHATKVLVLDRPNPLGGLEVGGPLLHPRQRSGYGKYPITHIHGMTIGELSNLFNEEIGSLLDVVPMTGWHRDLLWADTGLPWTPPSPNLPTVASAVVYGATVFLEATTVSEGRGTTTPFELFGAPFLSAQALATRLTADFPLPSGQSAFRAAYYTPTFSKFNGSTVPGVQWFSTRTSGTASATATATASTSGSASGSAGSADGFTKTAAAGAARYDTFLSGTKILCAVRDLSSPPAEFQWDGVWFGHPGTDLVDQYAGTELYRSLLDDARRLSAEEIVQFFEEDVKAFTVTRSAFLMY